MNVFAGKAEIRSGSFPDVLFWNVGTALEIVTMNRNLATLLRRVVFASKIVGCGYNRAGFLTVPANRPLMGILGVMHQVATFFVDTLGEIAQIKEIIRYGGKLRPHRKITAGFLMA